MISEEIKIECEMSPLRVIILRALFCWCYVSRNMNYHCRTGCNFSWGMRTDWICGLETPTPPPWRNGSSHGEFWNWIWPWKRPPPYQIYHQKMKLLMKNFLSFSFDIIMEFQKNVRHFLSMTFKNMVTNLVDESKINTVLPTKTSGNMTMQNFANACPIEFPV